MQRCSLMAIRERGKCKVKPPRHAQQNGHSGGQRAPSVGEDQEQLEPGWKGCLLVSGRTALSVCESKHMPHHQTVMPPWAHTWRNMSAKTGPRYVKQSGGQCTATPENWLRTADAQVPPGSPAAGLCFNKFST